MTDQVAGAGPDAINTLLEFSPEGRREPKKPTLTAEDCECCEGWRGWKSVAAVWDPLAGAGVAAWSCIVGGYIAHTAREDVDKDSGNTSGNQSRNFFLGILFFGSAVPLLLKVAPPKLSALSASFGELCWLAGFVMQERVLCCGDGSIFTINQVCDLAGGEDLGGSASGAT